MADQPEKPGLVGRILRAMPSVLVHSLCLSALLLLLWVGGGNWSRAADEVLMERNPTTDALLGLISAIVHHPSTTLVLLSLLLLIDFTLLVYLDRSGARRLGRDIWSGTLFVAMVAVAFLTAYSLSSDASRHLNNMNRGDDIRRRQQGLKRLDQFAGIWKLIEEEHHGERTDQTESQHGRLVIERREGEGAESENNRTANATMSLTLAGEERRGTVSFNIARWPPEYVVLIYENNVRQEGIYRFEDNRLELCLAPVGTYPSSIDFSTKESPNALYVFERVETHFDGTP
jgi:hypothetical protein